MTVKTILYIISFTLALYGLDGLDYNKFIKNSKPRQAQILYLIIAMSLSYLATNFLYDFFLNTKII
ncbi:MAG: DUF1146 domain-containing protein [Bacilli bacterium]|nr:DUF1146 domain-containing protein [Bacilli bacterium]